MQTESKIRYLKAAKGVLALAAGLALAVSSASAQVSSYADKQMGEPASDHLPTVLNKVSIVQKLNTQIPLDGEFRDDTGKAVRMGDYFGKRPAILALV
jgi:protein SCO1/2